MENFKIEGKSFWEDFGKGSELLPRHYFDFVSSEKYKELLKDYNIQDKKMIDIGAGYPTPKEESMDKESSPLASELQEILERKGASIIPIDVAIDPLQRQKEAGKEVILGSAFELPFKDETIDGGSIILNLLNSSFKGEGGKEIFLTKKEVKNILEEVYRVLQEKSFVVVNNYGYVVAMVDNLVKMMGPEKDEVVTLEEIKQIAKEIGFKKIESIPLDPEKVKSGNDLILESFPKQLKERISVNLEESGALFIEK
ncbi:hypothetical protein HN615_06660 [Candidatus Woesearchaeota archaeon]|jgi:ubiquinone/menaquinone biosynthesis C-methylase UbiE|nr:hypothetical protein [Candidatus Woesearchaeota archaeon]